MKKNFKLYARILIALCVLMMTVIPTTVSAAGSLDISATYAEGSPGDTVEITLTVDNNPGFAILWITITEVEGIEMEKLENGNVMRDCEVGRNVLWDAAKNSTNVGTLAKITFKITDKAKNGLNSINVIVRQCIDENGRDVMVSFATINIKVNNGQSVETEEIVTEEIKDTTVEVDTTNTPEVNTENVTENVTAPIEPEETEKGNGNNNGEIETITPPDAPEIVTDAEGNEPVDTELDSENVSVSIPTETEENLGADTDADNDVTDSKNDETVPENKKGCGQSISGAAAALILPAIAIFALKRKKD